jgi:hypothetical protein
VNRAGFVLLLCAALVAAWWVRQPRAAEENECAVPSQLTEVSFQLPHVAERIKAKQPVKIVAIGGASTKGSAAGGPDYAYPHQMQLALAGYYPEIPFTVVNKGVARQTTQQMLERFPTDVFTEDPVLVIWEAGISDAVRGIEIDDFAAALQTGIDEVKKRAIDIVLVDMQFSRSTTAVIDFERYMRTIHRIGDVNSAYVFPRFEMMRYWSEQHMFNFDATADDARARLAAKVYNCLGRALASDIRAAVQ